jgi:GTP pyrophosphokinase
MVATKSSLPVGNRVSPEAIDTWLTDIGSHYSAKQQEQLHKACDLAAAVLAEQLLSTGEGRLRHNLATADILAHMRLDAETLETAILNGVLEGGKASPSLLKERFGAGVARMVENLARLGQFSGIQAVLQQREQAEHAENLRRLLLGIAEDVRAMLVVLAERLHLMRASKGLDDEVRRRLARESRELYGPLANRLGIWQIKWELEDLSLRFLDPQEYQRIASLLDGRRADREAFITQVIDTLKHKFAEAGIHAAVSGRPKHIYSIYRKMQRKAVDFDQIFDVRAVRVLVDTVADCYGALGVVHGLWRHIPGEFDDYIATPKTNMYQSIHTAVIGPEDKALEVQIRTKDMHRHAELGVAAHWRYKENSATDLDLERRILWMRHWLELKDEGEAGDDFVERFKAELEPVQIYVLTPQHKVIELPKGSTPLDFAYAIHSEIGHKCRGARVNGRIVTLTQPLASGQMVEIITAKNGTPSRDWLQPHLGYLKTSKARNRVRQWFKQQDFDLHLGQGRAAVERELGRLGVEERPDLERVAVRFNFKRADDLLAAVGRGELSPIQVLNQAELVPAKAPEPEQIAVSAPTAPPAKGEVMVAGVGDLMTHTARCCKPVPPDPILGFITRGRGVTVHRSNCPNLRNLSAAERERMVPVQWTSVPKVDSNYPVDIQVKAADRKGLLRDISSALANEDINVIRAYTHSDRTSDIATMRFTIEIGHMAKLDRVLGRLMQIPDVIEVQRRS